MVPLASLLILLSALAAPLRAADSGESVPSGEDEASALVARLIEGTVAEEHAKNGAARRDAHAKAHGCVRATFRVDDALPADLRQGVFQPGRSYASWIRFSNGTGKVAPDAKKDGRGMAIKLMGAPGPKLADDEKGTQDFLLINSPVFFVRNAEDYTDFSRVSASGKPFSFFLPSLNPCRWRLHELRVALALLRKKTANPLSIRYWSMTPYLMGESGPAKFSARPCSPPPAENRNKKNPNFLRDAMSARLKSGSACFEFLVQLRADPARQPIEDPTVEWGEKKTPFRRVATIEIPAQRFESPAQQAFCENLSMNPWHAVAEHRPLGGINRVRKVVYETISKLRHSLNGVPRTEPTGAETFPD